MVMVALLTLRRPAPLLNRRIYQMRLTSAAGWTISTLVAAAGAPNLAAGAALPTTIAADNFGPPAFQETFATLDAGPDANAKVTPLHRWRTVTGAGGPAAAGYRSLNAATYFGDATTGSNPFAVGSHGLTITATKSQNLPFGFAWNSGFLSSKFSYSFMHGYAEVTANIPACIKGAWSAPLWLLPVSGQWPLHGEVDVPETVGTGVAYWTAHNQALGKSAYTQLKTQLTCDAAGYAGWHTYGVLWRADAIGYYLDRKLIGQEPTPADYSVPMYLVSDLMVGGSWAGDPAPSTSFIPMYIGRMTVWSSAAR
jgi:beta-glucanase (GH16 family)